ncbi:MAG: glycine C-acetyltransferase [Candidatus Caldipriscus sp.]|nr:glycine C-acetyltransferase [Candidatus Caldipriscus sp.]
MANQKFLEEIKAEIENLKEAGLYVNIRTVESAVSSWMVVDGKRVLNLTSNNYLGFASEPRLREAAKRALDEYGIGPAAVRTISGTMSLHLILEKLLAEFKGAEAVISYQSGFKANLSVIPSIVSREDGIFSDELNHASIIDGCRLSRAEIIRYAHADVDDLRKKLAENRHRFRRALVVTDGVFSMDGDIAPLPEIVKVAKEYDAIVMVDDAHGEGVLGRGGRGIVDHFDLHGEVDIEIGTLSKAFGVVGGYAASSSILVDYLRQKSRPFLFSSAMTVPDTAACIEAVKILQESEDRVKRLWENANYFKKKMKEAGFNTWKSQTPITPIVIGDEKKTQEFSKRLFDEGIFVQAIVYPTVPKGTARVRVMISAIHTKEDLDFAAEKFIKVGQELGII